MKKYLGERERRGVGVGEKRGKKPAVGLGGGHADFANNNALDVFFMFQQRITPSSIKRTTS